MIHDHLLDELDKVAARIRHLRFWRLLATAWLAAAAVAALLCFVKITAGLPTGLAAPLALAVAAALAGVGAWLAATAARDPSFVARRVEAAFPELRTCLLAAVEQRPDLPGGRYGYLQSSVIRQALNHAQRHPWPEIVSQRSIVLAALANCVAMVLFAVALAAVVFTVAQPVASAAAALADRGLGALGSGFAVTVEPGNAEVERGTSLLVLARVTGRLPAEATLIFQSEGSEETRLPMNASLDDPVFGGRIPIVDQPLKYHVELGGQKTPTYKVEVFEYPRLERADAKLVYPQYTGLEPRLIQDVRTVSAVEGTELTIICRLNKPVASAMLVDTRKDAAAEPIVLSANATEPAVMQATLKLTESRRLALNLVDEANRKNIQLAQFSIHVLPNQPPTLKPTFPARDLEVSALEELDVKATVYDDIGLVRHGLAYSLAGQEPVEVVLGERAAAKQKHELAHLVRLEELKAEPDQLLSYYWWAEDHGPDGQVRRAESDMYFAEVRPFEEIFRQGQQPPGGEQQQRQQQQQGQGQNAQDAQQLAQLQKEIINATWKLIRREIGEKLTDAFASDAEQVQLSQAAALEQAAALAQRLMDEKSQEHIETVLKHMTGAAGQLQAAHDGPTAAPLKSALADEQAALQALLKLRAREHDVVRQQQRQRSSQGQQRQSQSRSRQQQQQLNQLDLRDEQNRYETQRTAQEQQQESAADRENRQVLNRLRELARRQHDLNERLKELQTALEEASTEQQKEEIRRQLKRLQDEQREILQNTDELQSRLDQPENAEQMAEQRQQLDETRDNVRRASEALEQQQVTQAAASGTRAEQQFEDLREEFRRRAANRFSEEVKQMRDAAQQLDERQQDLSQRLNQTNNAEQQEKQTQQEQQQPGSKQGTEGKPKQRAKTKSLREDNQRERIAEDLGQQRQRLGELQNQMRETIQEAEQTEPLLSERLYDAARGVQERQLDQTLQSAERSVRQGLAEDARQQEQAAGQGIQQLREGIERASEAVLGDETEALRQARQRLEDLSRELDQEIQQRQPGQQPPGQQQPGQQQQGQQQQGQPGQQPGQQQQQGQQQQPGQQQQGQGERQPGQQQQGQQGQQQQPGEQQGQPGQQQGQPQPGQQQPGQGERQPGGRQTGPRRLGDPGNQQRAGANEGNGNERRFAPLTGDGEGFREWSDRLRDVEEMVQDPELRAEAARIRERARALRAEFKRHSDEPNWDLVQQQVAGPLFELRDRVVEELLRRTAKKAVVPLDRDPVPPQYSEKTRRYYEQLGERPMIVSSLVLGAREWLGAAIALSAVALAVLAWSYLRGPAATWLRTTCTLLKAAGIVLLAICLVEPLWTGSRPKPGSNLFLVVADNSQSLELTDRGNQQTRAAAMLAQLTEPSPWLTRLAQDFDVRRYAFDTTLRPVKDFSKELTSGGESSALAGSLGALSQRFRGQPIAGILLLTDGNATDLADRSDDWKSLPPVYPVAIGAESGLADLAVSRVSVSQTNFEAAPVTIAAEIAGQGLAGRRVVLRVLDATGKEVERRVLPAAKDGETLAQRFLVKPDRPGVSFFTVEACLEGEEQSLDQSRTSRKVASQSAEATLANNRRLATVDRGGGPYRVLYVSGRPNWEYKFLRRAVEEDDEVTLVGLIRIAKKEPKFSFLGRQGERTNPLFRGFNNQRDENAEQYDQPVLLRFGLAEGETEELRGGFPKDAEDLFRYHAVILDDLEAAFFTQDQQSLLAEFVSQRGGALLMLGGNHSLAEGGYQRTPIGEMLPVYLDRSPPVPVSGAYRLKLTREGWLQPWVRVRANEPDEEERLAKMPGFKALNRIDAIKPGASVLAEVEGADGTLRPALVVQPFGRGRAATLLVGDLWRWGIRRPDPTESDLEKSWRQTVRWLVSDVPKPVEVETRRGADSALPGVEIVVRARDKEFQPLDNAQVTLKVHTPDKRQIELIAEATGAAAGEYRATFAPRDAGAYRTDVVVTAPDGSEVGKRETGWAVEPETEEFRTLAVNRPLLDRIAQESGGEVISLAGLESFVSSLPNRKIPVMENWTWPLWHQWGVLTAAIGCLVGEWGLRRWRGLP